MQSEFEATNRLNIQGLNHCGDYVFQAYQEDIKQLQYCGCFSQNGAQRFVARNMKATAESQRIISKRAFSFLEQRQLAVFIVTVIRVL